MRTRMPVLGMIALVGFCSQANAQARCPELTRLRSEVAGGLKADEARPDIGPLRSIQSFFYGMGYNTPIRQ